MINYKCRKCGGQVFFCRNIIEHTVDFSQEKDQRQPAITPAKTYPAKLFICQGCGKLADNYDTMTLESVVELPDERKLLLQALKLIKSWHNFQAAGEALPEAAVDAMWRIYYERSPEMLPFREYFGLCGFIHTSKDPIINP